MEKTIVTSGKTIDLAIDAALSQLGLDRDSVSVQVLQQAKSGFLGFGAQPAKVQVTYEAPDEKPQEKQEAPKSALGSASRSKPKKAAVPAPRQEAPQTAEKPQAPKAAAAKEYAEKKGILVNEPEEKECMSGIADRPYCKGRNYDPNRYRKNTED